MRGLNRVCIPNALEDASIVAETRRPAARPLLTKDEWQILWVTTKKSKPPKKLPSIKWAYESLGKLGGWYDSNRTGIIGWQALWKRWFRLNDKQ